MFVSCPTNRWLMIIQLFYFLPLHTLLLLFTTTPRDIHELFLFFSFLHIFPHLSSCLISWSFPAPSHLGKSWNIKQTHTSGLVMLTSVARVCVRLCVHVCVCACMCSVGSDAAMINCRMHRIYHSVTAHNRHERAQTHSRTTNTWREYVELKLNWSWTRKQIPTSKNRPLLSLQRLTAIFYVFLLAVGQQRRSVVRQELEWTMSRTRNVYFFDYFWKSLHNRS